MKTSMGAILTAAALSACAGAPLSRSPELAAVDGRVKFEKISRDSTGIELRIKHLAEPDQLAEPGYAYVAWVQSGPEDEARNVGALNLAPNLEGELRTSTDLRRFQLFVTAEATSDAARPTGQPLLWASR